MNRKREKKFRPKLIPAILWAAGFCLLASPVVAAPAKENCDKDLKAIQANIDRYKAAFNTAYTSADASEERKAKDQLNYYESQFNVKTRECEQAESEKREKEAKAKTDEEECAKRTAQSKKADGSVMWRWSPTRKKCDNLMDSKDLPDSDECSSASVFDGQLKGQNCKKAMKTVKDVQTRNSAISESTTAATAAYGSMQAMQATGQQADAQARQRQVYQVAALSKMASAAANLQGAMQLKSAASGAAAANSTISDAQRGLAAKCPGGGSSAEDQECFFRNASEFGITPSQQGYATFERMKVGAQQSQDQADAANQLAKSSMITGLADTLIGLQAMKMAQQAGQNAQALAPAPVFVPPPPPGFVSLGGGGPQEGPSLAPAPSEGPIDYGNPSDAGPTFGDQNNRRINGGLAGGRVGTPSSFRPASSGVSGGGGGGSASGAGGKRGGGGGGRRGSRARNSAVGEYNLTGGGGTFKGGVVEKAGEGGNPFADALAKLFPPDKNGAPVVDARQIASGEIPIMEEEELAEDGVTATDLSLFEQITAKYRQLDGTGRF